MRSPVLDRIIREEMRSNLTMLVVDTIALVAIIVGVFYLLG